MTTTPIADYALLSNRHSDPAAALRRAESAYGEHEKRIGRVNPDWTDWYALYMVREENGQEFPT